MIGRNAAEKTRDGCYSVSDFNGNDHIYPPATSGSD
jgi:lysine 2,3-aminomutase